LSARTGANGGRPIRCAGNWQRGLTTGGRRRGSRAHELLRLTGRIAGRLRPPENDQHARVVTRKLRAHRRRGGTVSESETLSADPTSGKPDMRQPDTLRGRPLELRTTSLKRKNRGEVREAMPLIRRGRYEKRRGGTARARRGRFSTHARQGRWGLERDRAKPRPEQGDER